MTKIAELLASATAAPWAVYIDDYGDEDEGRPGSLFIGVTWSDSIDALYIRGAGQGDAALIVEARNRLPLYLELEDAARDEKRAIDAYNDAAFDDDSVRVPLGEAYARAQRRVRAALAALELAERVEAPE